MILRQAAGRWRWPKSRGGTAVLPVYRAQRPALFRVLAAVGGGLLLLAVAILMGRQVTVAPQSLTQLSVPLAIMALVAIWALPEGGRPPVGLMRGLFFLVLVVLVLWPNYLAISIPGLPWITLLRLFGVPMILCLLVAISMSPAFRRELRELYATAPVMWNMFGGICGLMIVSIAFSADPAISVQRTVVFWVYALGVAIVAAWCGLRRGFSMIWAAVFVACLLPISAIALLEQRAQHVLWVGHIPSFLAIDDPTVVRILTPHARAASGIYRVQGPATTPLGLAEYIAYAVPFVIHFAATARSLLIRLGMILLMPVAFVVIVATDSRLGIVGYVASILLYALLWGARRWLRGKDSVFGPALTLAFPLMLVSTIVASFVVGRFRHMVWGSGAQQYSTDARRVQIAMGLPKILQRPLGWGVGQGGRVLGYYNLAGVRTIDSYFLALALEIGPIGFILFVAIFCYLAIRCGYASLRAEPGEEQLLAPFAIVFVNFLVIKSILAQDANHPMVFMVLGMAVALMHRQSRRLENEAGVAA